MVLLAVRHFERLDRIGGVTSNYELTMLKRPAAYLQGVGDIRQFLVGVLLQMFCQVGGCPVQRRGRFGGDDKQLKVADRLALFDDRRLLDNYMGVGSTNSDCTDAGTPRLPITALPFRELGVYIERAVLKIELRIRPLKVQRGRQLTVLQRQHRLDQPGCSRRNIQMSDIGFGSTDGADALGLGARERPSWQPQLRSG